MIAAGATFSQIGNLGLNQDFDESTSVDGTLNLNTRTDSSSLSVTVGTLNGASTGIITSGVTETIQTLNVTGDSADGTYAGRIESSVSLVKSGNSKLTLTGVNNQTGPTLVNGGTLAVDGSLPATSAVTVGNGGTLSGSGTVNGVITLASGSVIAAGSSVGTLTTVAQTWNGGATLAVEMIDPAGSPGTGWDRLAMNGSLTLDPSVTSGSPFVIQLSAAALAFDNSQSQSWLIVSSTGIQNGFSADKFSVDAAAFAASNPLDGGQFSASNSGGDLYLNFTPVIYTALENWRVTHFGDPANSGDGADDFDYDSDGMMNLLEYAVDTDPKASSASPLALGKTLDGTKMTITFTRIADPTLNYSVEAENDPATNPWPSIWSSTGPSNVAGPVTVDDLVPIISQPVRFLRLRVER